MKSQLIAIGSLCATLAGCMFYGGPKAMSKKARAEMEAPPGTVVRTAMNLALSMDKRELVSCPPAPSQNRKWDEPWRDGSAYMASVGRLVSTGTLLRVESVYENTDPFAGGFIAHVTVLSGRHTGLKLRADDLYGYDPSYPVKPYGRGNFAVLTGWANIAACNKTTSSRGQN